MNGNFKMDQQSSVDVVDRPIDISNRKIANKQFEFSKYRNFSSKSGVNTTVANQNTKLTKPMSSNNMVRIGSTETTNKIVDKSRHKTYGNNLRESQKDGLKNGLRHSFKAGQLDPYLSGSPIDTYLVNPFFKTKPQETRYSLKLNEILDPNTKVKEPILKSKQNLKNSNILVSQQFIFM
jgi:hypothetical protein